MKNRIYATVFVALAMVSGCKQTVIEHQISLETKHVVVELTKIELTPKKISDSHPLKFELKLESFENPDALEDEVEEWLFLEVNGTPVQLTHWYSKTKTDTQLSGIATFDPLDDTPKTIKMTLFNFKDTHFEWIVNDNH